MCSTSVSAMPRGVAWFTKKSRASGSASASKVRTLMPAAARLAQHGREPLAVLDAHRDHVHAARDPGLDHLVLLGGVGLGRPVPQQLDAQLLRGLLGPLPAAHEVGVALVLRHHRHGETVARSAASTAPARGEVDEQEQRQGTTRHEAFLSREKRAPAAGAYPRSDSVYHRVEDPDSMADSARSRRPREALGPRLDHPRHRARERRTGARRCGRQAPARAGLRVRRARRGRPGPAQPPLLARAALRRDREPGAIGQLLAVRARRARPGRRAQAAAASPARSPFPRRICTSSTCWSRRARRSTTCVASPSGANRSTGTPCAAVCRRR